MTYRFTREIVEQLGGMIIRGDAPAGENLPIEAELAKQFDASRTVVREAVKMLTAKGLIGSRPRRGTYVEPETSWNLLDPDVLRWTLQRGYSVGLMREFLIVRQGIEPIAASEAARIASAEDLEKIKTCLDKMVTTASDSDLSLEADIAFHIAILEASGNRFIRQFSAVVDTALRYSIRVTNYAKGVQAANVDDHAAVYHAIVARDPEGAAKAVDDLLCEAIALLDRLDLKKATIPELNKELPLVVAG